MGIGEPKAAGEKGALDRLLFGRDLARIVAQPLLARLPELA